MNEEKSPRDLRHELGNVLQEKVALQYLLLLAADQIEQLADGLPEGERRTEAIKAVERFRRSAVL